MADRNPRADSDELIPPDDEQERGIADEEEEFEETDDLDEEEDEDEDLEASAGVAEDRRFTEEIGSEGGSQGDLESDRRRPRVMRGSEATTTARVDERRSFDDRREGGGPGTPRQ